MPIEVSLFAICLLGLLAVLGLIRLARWLEERSGLMLLATEPWAVSLTAVLFVGAMCYTGVRLDSASMWKGPLDPGSLWNGPHAAVEKPRDKGEKIRYVSGDGSPGTHARAGFELGEATHGLSAAPETPSARSERENGPALQTAGVQGRASGGLEPRITNRF